MRGQSSPPIIPSSFPAEVASSPVVSIATDADLMDETDAEGNEEFKSQVPIERDGADNFDEATSSSPGLSHRSSSPAVSINTALTRAAKCDLGDMVRAEMDFEYTKLLLMNTYLQKELTQMEAKLKARNAQRLAMQRVEIGPEMQLADWRKNVPRSLKTDARFMTKADIQDAFENEERVEEEKAAQEAKEAEQQKKVTRALKIQEDTASRIFTESSSSYRKKEDFIVLDGALGLSTVGTNNQLHKTPQKTSHATLELLSAE